MGRYVINRDKINAICDAIDLNKDTLPDGLYGNILKAIALKCGASSFPDNLYTTFVRAALTALGVDPDELEHPYLLGELLDALVEAVIEDEIPSPEEIYEEPTLLMMGGNPNPDPDSEEKEELVCPYCGKTYVMEYYYKQHLRTHENEGGEE